MAIEGVSVASAYAPPVLSEKDNVSSIIRDWLQGQEDTQKVVL